MGVMRRTTRRRPSGPSRLTTSESGFALIEVMVSAVLVVVLATATLAIIERSASSAAGNRQRSVAVAMAQADQDSMRQRPIASLTNHHTSVNKTQGNTQFTIKSDAIWLRDAGGPVSCAANSTRAEYVKITSQVSWVGHPKPVVLESYIAPGVTGVQKGALTVKLKTDTGQGTSGIWVAASGGGSGITDDNGCVVLGNLTPGPNTVSWGASGYVDRNGSSAVSESVSVATGQTSQLERLYDRSAQATAKFVEESQPPVPVKWTSVSVTHTGITNPTNATRSFVVPGSQFADEGVASSLFPFVAPYSFYAGSCVGNAPTTWLASATMPTAAPAAATTNTVVNVTVPTVAVYVTSNGQANGTGVGGASIGVTPATTPSATYPKMAGCTETIARDRGTGTAASRDPVKTAADPVSRRGWAFLNLPYGQWRICADNGSKNATAVLNNTPPGTTTEPPSHVVPAATMQAAGIPTTMPNVVLQAPGAGSGKCA
jgi:Tfp pilus assembly protein PilV